MSTPTIDLSLASLRRDYERGERTPLDVVERVYARIAELADPALFIHLAPLDEIRARARALMELPLAQRGPLHGVPFAIKDNIDVAGWPTTAACPEFRYLASETAFAVQRLLDAGAIAIGKTNLDQFATGLVGARSPYGTPRNPFNPAYVPGGSSSGSAVAVASGVVTFALGTDTAGSGRVPAAMNNIVGLKPTRGAISTHGVVPACRALDCVSVFSGEVSEGAQVLALMAGVDERDPYQRAGAGVYRAEPLTPGRFRFGVPRAEQLTFFDAATREVFEAAAERLAALGGERVTVDFEPFARVAEQLYGGAWVAQRLEAAGALLERDPEAIEPSVRRILEGARAYSALDAYAAEARLGALRGRALGAFAAIDVLLVPSVPGPVTLEAVRAEPIAENTRLGAYTNFVNLLDLCAVAVPAGFGPEGVPRGVTLIGPPEADGALFGVGDALHRACGLRRGASAHPLGPPEPTRAPPVRIVVAGAHMDGMALNHELTALGARLLERTRTAPRYRFYALATSPPKPGLVRVEPHERGHAIEVEVWTLSASALGRFVSALPAPMALGRVELESGEGVTGFLCEPYALAGARDISELGGWRRYLARA